MQSRTSFDVRCTSSLSFIQLHQIMKNFFHSPGNFCLFVHFTFWRKLKKFEAFLGKKRIAFQDFFASWDDFAALHWSCNCSELPFQLTSNDLPLRRVVANDAIDFIPVFLNTINYLSDLFLPNLFKDVYIYIHSILRMLVQPNLVQDLDDLLGLFSFIALRNRKGIKKFTPMF